MKQHLLALTVVFLFFLAAGCAGQAQEDRGFHTSGNRDADQRAEQRMAQAQQLKGNTNPGSQNPLEALAGKEKKSLYERLGGEDGITKIVDDFTTRALADPRVNWKRVGVTRGGINFKRNVPVEWKPTDDQI